MAEEKNFENRVKQWLRSKGCYVVKYYGCGGTRAGVPDLLVCANGRFVGVEIKAEHGKLAPLQRSHLDKILTSGGRSQSLDRLNLTDLKSSLRKC